MLQLKTIWQRMRRTPIQSLMAISITSVTFFVAGLVIYTALISSALLYYFEQKPQIIAFLSDEKNEESVLGASSDSLQQRLKNSGKVAEVKYVSKEEALKIYQEQNKDDPLLLEMVTADILPASLEISATDPQYLDDIAAMLEKEEGIDEVIYQKDIIDSLLSWTTTIRRMGIALIIFFSLLSILVTLTITAMKIVLRKEEIEILKLVGATRAYISMPFILESISYSLIGAIIGWLITFAVVSYATPFLSALFQGIPTLQTTILSAKILNLSLPSLSIWPPSLFLMAVILGLLMLIAVVLGATGSMIALGRYIRL